MALYSVLEGSSSQVVLNLTDQDGAVISSADLSTATMTLYDQATYGIINSRNDTDILNTGPGVITTGGVCTITLVAADNAIIGDNREEIHVLTCSFTSGTVTARVELPFTVVRIDYA